MLKLFNRKKKVEFVMISGTDGSEIRETVFYSKRKDREVIVNNTLLFAVNNGHKVVGIYG